MSSAEQVDALFVRSAAELGPVDILINNAGINIRGPIDGLSLDQFREVQRVNVEGVWLASRAVVPHMKRQGWGRIVGVTTSLDTMIRGAPYGPSKAAHEAFIAVMGRELEGTGVTANVLIPGGGVATNMTAGVRSTNYQP